MGSVDDTMTEHLDGQDHLPDFSFDYPDEFNLDDFEFGNLSWATLFNSSSNITGGFGDWETAGYYIQVNYYMNLICLPIIVVIGVLGNVLSLLVFLCTHLKYQSSSIYLACLNVADTGFLVCVFLSVWMRNVGITVTNTTAGCRSIIYLSFVFAFISVWTVVCFTIERYIVVFYPLQKHKLCTPGRAKIVTGGLGVSAFLAYILVPLTSEVSLSEYIGLNCHPQPKYEELWQTFQHVDSIATVIIPSVLIILLNLKITVKICDFLYRKRLKSPTASGNETATQTPSTAAYYQERISLGAREHSDYTSKCPSSYTHTPSGNRRVIMTYQNGRGAAVTARKRRHNHQIRTTRALVMVSSIFLVLNLPSHVFKLYYNFAYIRLPSSAFLWQNLLQLLYYCNFAVNVFLYSACSSSFRAASVRLWRKWKHRLHNVYRKAYNLKVEEENIDMEVQPRTGR